MFFYLYFFAQQIATAEPTVIIDANGNVFEYEDNSNENHPPCVSNGVSVSSSVSSSSLQQLPQNNIKCNTSSQHSQKTQITEIQNTSNATSPSSQNTVSNIPTVNLDFENADIHSVIRIFAEVSGRNFILDESIQGKVTVRFYNVPWDEALAAILMSKGLGWSSMGNPYATSLQQGSIFVIAPIVK